MNRQELLARANHYLAKSRSGSLTVDEEAAWEAAMSQIEAMDARNDLNPTLADLNGRGADGLPGPTGARGRPDAVLRRGDSIADWSRRHESAAWRSDAGEGLSFDRFARGLLTGTWDDAELERRAASEGTDSAGGHLVPTPLAAEIIDLARNRMRVMQAGAVTVPMASQTLKVARLTADPQAEWRSEHGTIAEDDVAVDAVTFTARSLSVLVKASLEVIEDSQPNIGNVIENAMANSMALELDRVALRGTGVDPQPSGVINQSGVTTTPAVGTMSYAKLLASLGPLMGANHDATGVILSPLAELFLQGQVDSDGQPLRPPQMIADLPRFTTNQVPADLGVGNDETEVFVGDWRELMIGMRTDFRIFPLRERFMETGEVAFIAWMRADVQLSRPAAFNVLTGVTL